jgi:hypothetical protein
VIEFQPQTTSVDDVIVTADDGVFPLVALAEGKGAVARALLSTGVGTAPPADFQPPEGAEEPVRKGAHTSHKRLLKEIEEKRAARSDGNQWGGEARLGAAFRNELAKQAYPLIWGYRRREESLFR